MRFVLWIFALGALSCRGAAWVEVVADDGSFGVSFPGTPVSSVKPPAALLRPAEVREWTLDRGARGILTVNYYDLVAAARDVEPRLAMETDCRYPFTDSVFVATAPRRLDVGGVAAVAIAGRAPLSDTLPDGGYSEHRCILRNGRMFHLAAVGPDREAERAEGERFLNSFTLR